MDTAPDAPCPVNPDRYALVSCQERLMNRWMTSVGQTSRYLFKRNLLHPGRSSFFFQLCDIGICHLTGSTMKLIYEQCNQVHEVLTISIGFTYPSRSDHNGACHCSLTIRKTKQLTWQQTSEVWHSLPSPKLSGMYCGLSTFCFLVNVLDWEAKAQMGKKGVLSNHLRFRHGIVTLLTSSPMRPIPIAVARHSTFWPNIPHWGLFGIWISNYPFHKEDLMKKKNRKDTEMSPP